jgi:hypothetical protein|tara:strand:+ start:14456 stop:14728 length:273 start_codon:yes stop_codon:yes gene_type:complete
MSDEIKKSSTEKLTVDEREDVLSRSKAREVVREIMNFGVSNSQIVYIIKLLSLELEDIQLMNSINSLIDQKENLERRDELITSSKTKIYT